MTKFNLADRVHIDNCTSITATITRISIWGDPENPQTQYHAEYFHGGDLREYRFDEWRLTKIGSARDPGWVVDWAPARAEAGSPFVKPEYGVDVGEANRMNAAGLSTCDKCGAIYPSAPPGVLHKCGVCIDGICHPVKKEWPTRAK